MGSFSAAGGASEFDASGSIAPLVVLFERDDAIAVPLLSQLRLAGYDVRASRTPVELFALLGKQLVALVLVDLGNAAAGRREFWVAMDAQRRGRAMQVMTFRFLSVVHDLDPDFDPAARALADVEVRGAQEFQRIVEGVRQRVPLHAASASAFGGSAPGIPGAQGFQGAGAMPRMPGSAIPPIGAVLGVPSPFAAPMPFAVPPGAPYAQPPVSPTASAPAPYAQPLGAPGAPTAFSPTQPVGGQGFIAFTPAPGAYAPAPSPFAHPAEANPFGAPPASAAGAEAADSPFAQPYAVNPFAAEAAASAPGARPWGAQPAPGTPSSGTPSWGNGSEARNNASTPDSYGYAQSATRQPTLRQPAFDAPAPSARSHDDEAGFTSRGSGYGELGGSSGYGTDAGADHWQAPPREPVQDAWIPPDGGWEDDARASEPHLAYAHAAIGGGNEHRSAEHAGPRDERRAAFAPTRVTTGHASEPARLDGNAEAFAPPLQPQARAAREMMGPTAPVPTPTPPRVPAVHHQGEQALGSVLVEGALLTEQRLDVLQGIQQMLGSVNIDFKLGELALLFKFLSPDQLLAALLVSRGLVSPQQIAGLGRVKQELAASGMDHDLETLLLMFHILPPEQLQQLRAELG